MRELLRDKERLAHMLQACDTVDAGLRAHPLEEALADPLMYHGLVKQVEIIGEATYKLTHEYRAAHPEVPWKQMEGMRHVLVHDYYNISPSDLVSVVLNDLPALRPLIQALYEEELKSNP